MRCYYFPFVGNTSVGACTAAEGSLDRPPVRMVHALCWELPVLPVRGQGAEAPVSMTMRCHPSVDAATH